MFLAGALKEVAEHSIRRKLRRPARCAVCGDLDIKNPEAWSTGSSSAGVDPFDHLFCTRSVSRGDLKKASEAGCIVCAAFYATVADDIRGDGIGIRLLPDMSVESLLEAARGRQGIDGYPFASSDIYGSLGRKHIWSSGKPPIIEQGVQSTAILSLISKSLETCLRDHDQCRRPPANLPTRVLDVSTQNIVRLVEPAAGTVATFVALSYCWGRGKVVTTTSTTIDEHRDGTVTTTLPQTIQDAVQLTRDLDIQYLWVDALCIIQDSPRDWQIESAKMGSIYADAHVTIAATSAAAATEGFLRSEPDDAEVKLSWPDGSRVKARLTASDPNTYRDDDPWGTRGWTFQERILSNRIVLYSSTEAQWICQGMRACECGNATLVSKTARGARVQDDKLPTTIWDVSEASSAYRFWTDLVSTYSKRVLTVELDRLPALSGIAATIAAMTKSSWSTTYVAGLWREDLLQGLFWSRSTESPVSEPGVYRGPTFSWVRIDGPINYSRRDGARDAREPEMVAEVVDAGVVVDGENPFGRLTAGHIRLRGLLFPCTLRKTAVTLPGETSTLDYFNPDVQLCTVTEAGSPTYVARKDTLLCMSEPPAYKDVDLWPLSRDPGEETTAWLFYIGCKVLDQGDDPARYMLVLGPSPVQKGAYERLGVSSPSPVFPFEMPKGEKQEVLII